MFFSYETQLWGFSRVIQWTGQTHCVYKSSSNSWQPRTMRARPDDGHQGKPPLGIPAPAGALPNKTHGQAGSWPNSVSGALYLGTPVVLTGVGFVGDILNQTKEYLYNRKNHFNIRTKFFK